MPITTLIHVFTTDAQQYTEAVSFNVDPLAFAAAQDIPTSTLIEAFISATFASTARPSTSKVIGYSVEIVNDLELSPLGGNGSVATAIAAKCRSGIGSIGPVSPVGVPEGIELRIPGLNKSAVVFDPVNPNSISTPGSPFAAVRTALSALNYQDDQGNILGSGAIVETAIAFNGKRAPKRSR